MTKKKFFLKAAGISLALGMMVTACDTDGGGGGSGTSLAGTEWEGDGLTVVFTATTVTVTGSYNFTTPYTLTGTEITMTVPPPASVSGGIAKGIISGNQMTVTYGQNETYKLTKKTGTNTEDKTGGDTIKVTNEQVYQFSSGAIGGAYNGSGTLKIGRLTIGSVTNGRLSFELASTVQSQYLDSIPDWLNAYKVSPSNARGIVGGDIGLYNGNTQIGDISLGKIEGSGQHIIVYWYFDQAVEITGVSDGVTISINAHIGWNKVYAYIGQSYSGTMTTNLNNVPSDMKWTFQSLGN
jgi:hypothetical protein